MTRASDLQVALREGRRIRTAHLDIRMVTSPLPHPRVGIVVPLHQRNAVERNRLKRRLRELTRQELLPFLRERMSVDLVIRARREAYTASMEALRADICIVREGFGGDRGVSA